MNLADNLKRIRKENNLSQEQLAEKLGVSRQSVSKWESNQAYPEMDKMLQLCEMFNLNMDDLLNQNVTEVNNKKKSKINVNKYIDSFLDFLTKTTNMFGAMTFKRKLKCVFEQIFLVLFFLIIAFIVGAIASSIIGDLISFLPNKLYYPIYRIFEAIYSIACFVFGIVIILHIFKIRYLNYYVVVHDDKETLEEPKETTLKEEIKERIIIRDPKHSEYGFIKGLLNLFLIIIKVFALMAGIMFSISLISLSALLVLSFMIVNSGTLFMGVLLGLIAVITINILFLTILYNFILGNEIKGKVGGIVFLICLVLVGVSIGLIVNGVSNLEQVNIKSDKNEKYYVSDTYEYKYDENIILHYNHNNVEYHEADGDNVKLVLTHYKDYEYKFEKEESIIYYIKYHDSNEIQDVKMLLKDINQKQLVDYSDLKLDIYASKDNLSKLKITY